ncbi:hypothetical protein HII31_03917 [Pseudocercospora fuligena]|uniref:Uncharacterized protein n=1 Tax=Pseudocercospora fuligena TaxID=685502 RepID=A0A8H6RMP4_9PEZI|nr:hypothetical protein HII31_03917 [Pseudocercospora fuligena]
MKHRKRASVNQSTDIHMHEWSVRVSPLHLSAAFFAAPHHNIALVNTLEKPLRKAASTTLINFALLFCTRQSSNGSAKDLSSSSATRAWPRCYHLLAHDLTPTRKLFQRPFQQLHKSCSASVNIPNMASSGRNWKRFITLDVGTTKLSSAFFISDEDTSPDERQVYDAQLGYSSTETTSTLAFTTNASGRVDVHWGPEIEDKLESGALQLDDCINLIKLSLYQNHETTSLASKVDKKLRDVGITKQRALELWFAAILKKIKSQISTHYAYSNRFTPQQIDSMKVVLFLSVPEMWHAPCNRVMSEAARNTGECDALQLVYEGQASTAYYLHHMVVPSQAQFVAGQEFIVADAGGGTMDINRYVIGKNSNAGASASLMKTAPSAGGLLGSEMVDESFWTWLKKNIEKKEGGLDAHLQKMGLTELEFETQAKVEFSAHKKIFRTGTTSTRHVHIEGKPTATKKHWSFKLTLAHMRSFFDPIINGNIALIQSLDRSSVTKILIAGGFGQSGYFMDRLNQTFGTKVARVTTSQATAHHPVARGIAMRYHDIIDIKVDTTDCFGIGQAEPYDQKKHPDGVFQGGEEFFDKARDAWSVGTRGKKNPLVVSKSPYYHDDWVYDRWRSMTTFGHARASTTVIWQSAVIHQNDTTPREMQIYWAEKPIPDSSNIYIWAGEGGFAHGIQKWGAPLTAPVPNMNALGYQLTEVGQKIPEHAEAPDDEAMDIETETIWAYEVYWRITLTFRGANVGVKWQQALPKIKCAKPGVPDRDFVTLLDDELIDSAWSPMVRA